MTNTNKLSIAYTIAAFAGSVCLHAEDQPARNQETDATTQLAEYVVVANTYEVPLSQVGSTVEVITREDLEIGQTTFVVDALRDLPGVYVRNNGGPGTAFGITTRGLTDAPIILIDGIETSNAANGSITNPSSIFSNSIESVEFLKGAQSSLYGADALAGVINITTREVKPGETRGSISAGYGTYHTSQVTADLQTQQGPVGFTLGFNHIDSDGFSARSDDGERDEYRTLNLNSKVTYQITETLKLYATGYYTDAHNDVDSEVYGPPPTYPSVGDPFGKSEQEEIFTKTGAVLQANENWNTQVGYGYTKTDYFTETIFMGGPSPYRMKGERHKYEWRNVINLHEKWTLAAGTEYEEEKNKTDKLDRDQDSYYADNSFEIIDNLFWTLGGRYDDNSDYGSNETWRTTISYLIEPLNSRLHGSYGTSFTAPNFSQLHNPNYGNPNLDAEEGTAWDYGIEVTCLDGEIILDATIFHNEIDDQITYSYLGYTNNDQYESDGVELSAKWLATDNLVIRGNYTYTDADNKDGSKPQHVPENTANLSATWTTLDGKLQLKAVTRYVDSRYTYGGESDEYTLLDLAGQYSVNETITYWTAINNVFDKNYEEYTNYTSAGFNIHGGVRINF